MTTDLDEEPAGSHRRRAGRGLPRVSKQVIAFIGVLCAGVLIGWVVFRDDEPSAPAQATRTEPAVASNSRTYPKLGLGLGLPKGWKTSFRGSVLTAASADGTVSAAFSLAGGAGDGKRVRRSDRDELARLFKAREISRQRAKVGTATTIVTELLGVARNRRPIRILSMGASSRWRTYSIQVFTVIRPADPRLSELRALLASVRYRQPR
jgi:hypothetical protein